MPNVSGTVKFVEILSEINNVQNSVQNDFLHPVTLVTPTTFIKKLFLQNLILVRQTISVIFTKKKLLIF